MWKASSLIRNFIAESPENMNRPRSSNAVPMFKNRGFLMKAAFAWPYGVVPVVDFPVWLLRVFFAFLGSAFGLAPAFEDGFFVFCAGPLGDSWAVIVETMFGTWKTVWRIRYVNPKYSYVRVSTLLSGQGSSNETDHWSPLRLLVSQNLYWCFPYIVIDVIECSFHWTCLTKIWKHVHWVNSHFLPSLRKTDTVNVKFLQAWLSWSPSTS